MNIRRALITGITGQDGSFLAELLLKQGYEVHGIIRRSSNFNTQRIEHIKDYLYLYYGDLTDSNNLNELIKKLYPDEIYNLAAQSHVQVSFEIPSYTLNVDTLGTLNCLEAIKNYSPYSKFYQAGSSEMFGKVQQIPQNEKTPFYPRSPYGVAKVASHHLTVNYREAYNLFAVNGILFNHESERRLNTFVTRKITSGICEIQAGLRDKISLGNLYAQRDWGYAQDYVEAMYLMLQQETPEDYVISTGETTTIKRFCELVCEWADIDLAWVGEGTNEKGIDIESNKIIFDIDKRYFRPSEVDILVGDSSKAKEKLGWQPTFTLPMLIDVMMQQDISDVLKIKNNLTL